MEITYEEGKPKIILDGTDLLVPMVLKTYGELARMANQLRGNGHGGSAEMAYELAHELELWQLKNGDQAKMPE